MNNEIKPAAYPQVGVASTCRSYEEYCAMFNLKEINGLMSPVLDVAGGASSFTAQLHARGVSAMAVDPFYKGLAEDVIAAAHKEIGVSSDKIAANAQAFDWTYYGTPDHHRELRELSLARFASDFRSMDSSKRYYSASLPELPFEKDTFGLIVCSHFLFLYADTYGEQFHLDSIKELIRVLRPGGELRVYPLITLKWEEPSFLTELLRELREVADIEFLTSGLPFVPNSNSLLRLVKQA